MERIQHDGQQDPDERGMVPSVSPAASAAAHSSPADARDAMDPARRPRWRTHGVPIRVTSPATGATPSASAIPTPAAPSLPQRAEHILTGFARAAFINRNFALLWWGQVISSIGDYTWDTALVLWIVTVIVAGQSWAPVAVSAVILAAAIPQIVVAPLAGVFVDRWDKRRTMVVATGLQAALAALLIVPATGVTLPGIGKPHLSDSWLLGVTCIDVLLLSSCAQFFLPAQLALIKDIVAARTQDQAIEMTQAIQGLAIVLGPPTAAALVFGLGIGWALLVNALSFGICFLATAAITAPPSASSLAPGEAGHFSREFTAGVDYVLGHRVLRTILIAEILTWLGFGALQSLGYFFITVDLHAPPSSYGWFAADFGLGAIVGAVFVMLVGRLIGLARILWVALVTAGIFVTVMSHLTSLPLAFGAAFLFGISSTAILTSAGPLSIDATDRAFVGRVTAVLNPVGRLAAFVSVLLAGALAGTVLSGFHARVLVVSFDAYKVILTGTGLLAIAGGLYTRMHLRGVAQAEKARQSAASSGGEAALPLGTEIEE